MARFVTLDIALVGVRFVNVVRAAMAQGVRWWDGSLESGTRGVEKMDNNKLPSDLE